MATNAIDRSKRRISGQTADHISADVQGQAVPGYFQPL